MDILAEAGAVVATLLVGVLATSYGAQLAFAGIHGVPDPAQQHWIAWIGIKESLYNLDIALVFALVAVLLATFGRRRADVASAA